MRCFAVVGATVVGVAMHNGSINCTHECAGGVTGDAPSFKRGCAIPQDGTAYVAQGEFVDDWCEPVSVFDDCHNGVESLRKCTVRSMFAKKGEGCCPDDGCVAKQNLAKCAEGLKCTARPHSYGVCDTATVVV